MGLRTSEMRRRSSHPGPVHVLRRARHAGRATRRWSSTGGLGDLAYGLAFAMNVSEGGRWNYSTPTLGLQTRATKGVNKGRVVICGCGQSFNPKGEEAPDHQEGQHAHAHTH